MQVIQNLSFNEEKGKHECDEIRIFLNGGEDMDDVIAHRIEDPDPHVRLIYGPNSKLQGILIFENPT